jgi:hypothetical protein
MNDNIRQLAESAGFILSEDDLLDQDPAIEKFSELIVLECLNFIYCADLLGQPHSTVDRHIRDYFGVSE